MLIPSKVEGEGFNKGVIMQTLHVKISGITCDACFKLIKKKLMKLSSVTDVSIKDGSGETTITSGQLVSEADVINALQGTEFTVSGV